MWTNMIEWTNSIQNNKLDFFNMENIINVYDSDDIVYCGGRFLDFIHIHSYDCWTLNCTSASSFIHP